MEEEAITIESLVENAEIYTKTSVDLFKLEAIDKSADMLSSLVSTLIITFVVLCIALMVNIGAAVWLGELVGSSYCGFFIVAAFYIIVAIVLYTFRVSLLKTPFSNTFITHIRKEKNI